ncbi:MAG: penicillin-binding transpeptidase domain-containing protein [Fermentimonas sp.]
MIKRSLLSSRQYIISLVVIVITAIYIAQLFNLQVLNPQFREYAESNAFFRRTLYPARGAIYDRNGELLVYNRPTYDVMMVVREMSEFDTLDFCRTLSIDLERFHVLDAEMKDRRRNPGYSSYTPQLFMSQLDVEEYGLLQEKLYKFPGIYIRSRTERQYNHPNMGLLLGYVAEVDQNTIAADPYYVRKDYVGKSGIELAHEIDLRGEKGVEILLRDAHGRIQGRYEEGAHDKMPVSGKDLTLGIDIDLQAYGELLMNNKVGSIVMIEPATGEVLCMVSTPTYDPALLTGKQFATNYLTLERNPYRPLFNRAVAGTYPPGSTFKLTQGLVFLQEGIITPQTKYPCHGGYPPLGGRPGCHGHYSPLAVQYAVTTSCNSFFCYGLNHMLSNRKKYASVSNALDVWKDYMVNMGLGYRLGVDLPSENRGFIPNSGFYTNVYQTDRWNAHYIISIAIGQGEVLTTPLQIANLGVMIANRGYYYTPHVVKERKGDALETIYTERHESGIDKEHFELVIAGMADAVSQGTAWGVNLAPDVEVCGKTGTSENPHGDDHSLFLGFAPRDNPRVAIAVLVETGRWGATNAVPIARLMLQKFFRGEVPESDKWLETMIIERQILPSFYTRNLPVN